MDDATEEIMWVQSTLCELCVPSPRSAQLWCDNMGAKYLASNPIFHGTTNHVEIDYRFVRDRVLNMVLDIRFILAADQGSRRVYRAAITRKATRIRTQSQLDQVVIDGGCWNR
jgi:hypothetical protein